MTLATGGDDVYDIDVSGVIYRVHEFTTVGTSTFTVLEPGEVEYLIVAGGGGGPGELSGGGGAGGGGAGGLLTNMTSTALPVTVGSHAVVVGGGGTGGGARVKGGDGQPSSVFGLTALGGGAGGVPNDAASSGGSGGGAAWVLGAKGAGTAGQGNGGGDPLNPSGGGGGGAGAVGGNGTPTATSNAGGVGGAGLEVNITGAPVFYAGGGAGGTWDNTINVRSAGGAGGGGDGGYPSGTVGIRSGLPGVNGLGGGGGAGTGRGGNSSGGDGGSGIVIIRYILPLPAFERRVTIEGVDFTGDTIGTVTIRRGRDDVYSDPVAGYAIINLIDQDGSGFDIDPAVRVRFTMTNSSGTPVPLFTGNVTDIDRTVYDPGITGDPASITTLTAVGPLAKLFRRQVLAAGRPAEDDADRILAALEQGLSLTWEELPQDTWDDFDPATTWATIDPGFDPGLVAPGLFDLIALPPQDGGYSAFEIVSQASASAQGIIYETGTGLVGWDNADSRGDDPDYTDIPASLIRADGLRTSTSLSDIVNVVEVIYDGTGEEFRDDASIVTFGRYDRRIETLLANQAAALRYGEDYLLRHAFPLINLDAVTIRVDGLQDAQADALLALDINSPVFLEQLPDTVRVTNLPGFVEGLTWRIDAHRAELELTVSDAALSVGDIRWSQLPATLTWDDLPATLLWQDWRTSL